VGDLFDTRRGVRVRAVRTASIVACVALLASCAVIERSSVPSGGGEPGGASSEPSLNVDGRWLAFTSSASNLAGTDGNHTTDVFVRDQQTHAIQLVSRTAGGAAANAASSHPSISDDGKRIAFRSSATDLATGGGAVPAIYVRDLTAGTTTRVSVSSTGTPGNGGSDTPAISGNGRFVAFASDADNLVTGDGNHHTDVFVRDLQTGTTELASQRANDGPQGGTSTAPAINRDGRYVAFKSTSTNLVPSDTNGGADVFLRDRTDGAITRVSVATTGAEAKSGSGSPAISADGKVIAFDSPADNLVGADLNGSTDVFVRDLTGLTTSLVSADNRNDEGAGSSRTPALSADGRYVAFQTTAALLATDGNDVSDIYTRDRTAARTKRVSTTFELGDAHGPSFGTPALSGDGRSVSFQSSATDLAQPDADHVDDVFTRAAITPTIVRVNPSLAQTSPATLARGTAAYFIVRGTYFVPDVKAYGFGPGVTADSVTVLSENQLSVHVTAAADAAVGTASIVVAVPGTGAGQNFGGAAVCTCLQITG
jgi:Tol biopolymer transport system component